MRYQSSHLRPATVQILEGVLYSSPDEVVAELAPVLAAKCGAGPAILGRLVSRKAAWPAAAEMAARLDRESTTTVLDSNNTLPPQVLEVLFAKHGRYLYMANQFARRGDLPVSVAKRLATRRHRSLQHTIRGNGAFPVAAVWNQLEAVQQSGRTGRYSIQGAWAVCETTLDSALGDPELTEHARYRKVDTALRVMPGTRPPRAVAAKLAEAAARSLVPLDAVAGWARRGVDSSGKSWYLEMVQRSSEKDEGSRVLFDNDVLRGLCRYNPSTRTYIWTDGATAEQAAASGQSRIRAAAWAHPVSAAKLAEMGVGALNEMPRNELQAVAQNPALDTATARAVLGLLGSDAWLMHGCAGLEDTDRLEMLRGESGQATAGAIADALGATVQPSWVKLWQNPELFAAAIKAARTGTPGSVLLEAAVATWPERLETFVENVRLGHSVGTMVSVAVMGQISGMDAEAAKVVAGLIGEWDEPLAALVRAAGSL